MWAASKRRWISETSEALHGLTSGFVDITTEKNRTNSIMSVDLTCGLGDNSSGTRTNFETSKRDGSLTDLLWRHGSPDDTFLGDTDSRSQSQQRSEPTRLGDHGSTKRKAPASKSQGFSGGPRCTGEGGVQGPRWMANALSEPAFHATVIRSLGQGDS
jgi:hypothetical protein